MSDRLPLDEVTRNRREAQLQVTDRAALDAILDEALIAHVAVLRDGAPQVLPFACARDGDSLLLHGSTGSGLLRLAGGAAVCVAVTHLDGLGFARTTFDSSMRYRSVVVHGTATVVPDEEKDAALLLLSEHLFPGRVEEVRASTAKELAATTILRVSLDRVSVKVAAGPPEVDPDDVEPRTVWAGILPLALTAGDPLVAPDVPTDVPVPASVRRAALRSR